MESQWFTAALHVPSIMDMSDSALYLVSIGRLLRSHSSYGRGGEVFRMGHLTRIGEWGG